MTSLEEYRIEFFSKPIVVLANDRKDTERSELVHSLKDIGFQNVDTGSYKFSNDDPPIMIFHSGDVIFGNRVNEFIRYASEYAQAKVA